MAILNKEMLDNRIREKYTAEQNKREAKIQKTQRLANMVLELEKVCIDIIDTFEYLGEHGLETPCIRKRSTEYTNKLMFERIDAQLAISFSIFNEYQRLFYTRERGFIIELCIDTRTYRHLHCELKKVDFSIFPNFQVDDCIEMMQGFLDNFARFKADFMKYV